VKQFEYKVLSLYPKTMWNTKVDPQQLAEKLNQLGAEGWEVVNSVDMETRHSIKEPVLILKREIN
jgi:Domain of unknown function (DUF4177)